MCIKFWLLVKTSLYPFESTINISPAQQKTVHIWPHFCCNKLPQTELHKTVPIYYLLF